MPRHRLRGGHKVGAPARPLTHHIAPQPASSVHQPGNVDGPYGNPLHPPLPPHGHTQPPPPLPSQQQQQHYQLQHQQPAANNNNWGWGDEGNDGSWNWGEGDSSWSWNTNNQQQQQQQYHQQLGNPKQNYLQHPYSNQPHALPFQSLPQRSQQSFTKLTEASPAYSSAPSAESVPFQHRAAPISTQQDYVNGSNQNGQGAGDCGTDNWGSENWGNDWSSVDTHNNNQGTNTKQDSIQQHQFSDYQKQQCNQYQQQQQTHQQRPQSLQQQYPQPLQHLQQQQQYQNQYEHDVNSQNYIVNQDNDQQHQSESNQRAINTTATASQQPQHHHPVPSQTLTSASNSTEGEWGWDNADWQVNGQVLEQQHRSDSQRSSVSQPSPALSRDASGTPAPSQDVSGMPVTRVAGPCETVADGTTDWDYHTNNIVAATLTAKGQTEEESSAEVVQSVHEAEEQQVSEQHQQEHNYADQQQNLQKQQNYQLEQQNYHQQQNYQLGQQNHQLQQQGTSLQGQKNYQEQQKQHLTYEEQQRDYTKQHQMYQEQMDTYNAQHQYYYQQHSQQPEENIKSHQQYQEQHTQEQQQLQPQEQQPKYSNEENSQFPAEEQQHQSQIHDYHHYYQEQQEQQQSPMKQQPQHSKEQVYYQQKPVEHTQTQHQEYREYQHQQQHYAEQHHAHPEQEHHWDRDWGGADFDTAPASAITDTTMAGHSATAVHITADPIITSSTTAHSTSHETIMAATSSSLDHNISAVTSQITEVSQTADEKYSKDEDNINEYCSTASKGSGSASEEKMKESAHYGSYNEELYHISEQKKVPTPQSQVQNICVTSSSSLYVHSDITPASVPPGQCGEGTEAAHQPPTQSSSLALENFSDGWDDRWEGSGVPEENTKAQDDLGTNMEIPLQSEFGERDNVSPAIKTNDLEITDTAGKAWDDEWDEDVLAQSKVDTLAEDLDRLDTKCSPNEPVIGNEMQKSGEPSQPQPPSNCIHQDGNSADSDKREGYFSHPHDTSQVSQSEVCSTYPSQDVAGGRVESNVGDSAGDSAVGAVTPTNQHQTQDIPTQPSSSPNPREPLHPYSTPASQEPHNYAALPHHDPHLNTVMYTAQPPQDPYDYYPTPQPQEGVNGQRFSPALPVSDPIVSRIPDGASSIPEMPVAPIATASLSNAAPIVTGAVETGRRSDMEGERPDGFVSSQPPTTTSQPLPPPPEPPQPLQYPHRPPSSHTLPERPASNQSAHSTHSAHSILSQNQEVSIKEEGEMSMTCASPPRHHESPHVTNSGTVGVDPTAPPSDCPVGPPPVLGPHGAVPSLRARKGSPFQPPQSGQSSPSPIMTQSYSHQPQMFVPSQSEITASPPTTSAYLDMGANLETVPDNVEQVEQQSAGLLWAPGESVALNVKLAVAAPASGTYTPIKSQQLPLPSHNVPVVVPGMVKEEQISPPSTGSLEPPAAHSANLQTFVAKPKVQSLASMSTLSSSPGVLDLSKPARPALAAIDDGSQDDGDAPNFRRMVPGESSKGTSGQVAAYQGPALVPAMPSERVVTGNDNPHPVPPVRVKQEPGEVRSPPDGPATSDLSGAGAAVVPPIRSATIGSEEPKSRTFTSGNSGSRSDLTGEQRGGRWERDHSRDRSGGGYRDRSRDRGEGGGDRDYYRDDSPHSRHSYDRDDRRRRWRESDDSDVSDTDRRYYDSSRDRRERAYRDELDRYSDRPIKEEKDRSRDIRRDRKYGDRYFPEDNYRSYDDDPYYGRGDRSEPVSRSSSINNLDSEGERSTTHSHHHHLHHRSHHHRDRDYYSSRNREREREGSFPRDYYQRGSGGGSASGGWDLRDSRRDPRYYGQRGGYGDPYSGAMYEQYRLYYQYYQNHPMYKEYYQQWMKHYGQAYGHQPSDSTSFYDDRTSIHSGRSSVNDELKKSVSSPRPAYDHYGYYHSHPSHHLYNSSQFMQDFHGGQGYEPPSAIYPDGSFSHLKSYGSGEISGVASVAEDGVSEVTPQQSRLTPLLFGRPHIMAHFTPTGQLILVPPKDPRDGEQAIVQLRDTQKMLVIDPTEARVIHQMKCFPGPLALCDTHKDEVVRYCEQRATEAARNLSLHDRESVALLWEYLALLVKQNGKLYGSDIAALLLRGREERSGRTSGRSSGRNSGRSSPQDGQDDVSADASQDTAPHDSRGSNVQSSPTPGTLLPGRDETSPLRKFTDMLCLGRKREAVDYAMREGLWGHALSLAYKMDSTTHTRVLAAFSASIPCTDVLHTLFQQLSGKKPEITKSYTYEQWGDWRQHLAVMVSNPTGQPKRDRASFTTLGDTLACRGRLHAAHFCYLVADVATGSYSQKDSKLVLVGSSHSLPFQSFASNEAIQCTEVYEYARALDTANSPFIHNFQAYKLVYALRLTERGFPAEALRYCEVIGEAVVHEPGQHRSGFVSQVLELATKLKYHDLHYQMGEGEMADMPDPPWLINLRAACHQARAQDAAQEQQSASQSTPQQSPSSSTPQHQSHNDLHLQNAAIADSTYSQGPESYHNKDYSNQESYHKRESYHMQQSYPQESYTQMDSYPNQDQCHTQGQGTGYSLPDVMDGSSQQQQEGYDVSVGVADLSQGYTGTEKEGEQQPAPNSIPMMQPTSASTGYSNYNAAYWPSNSGYQQQQPTDAPSSYLPTTTGSDTPQPSSLPPSPVPGIYISEHTKDTETMGEAAQHSPLHTYKHPQPPYQSWDQSGQQPPQEAVGAPSGQHLSQHSQSTVQQRTEEEEAYWADITGKKGEEDEEYDEYRGDEYEGDDYDEEEEEVVDLVEITEDVASPPTFREEDGGSQLRHRHPCTPTSTHTRTPPPTSTPTQSQSTSQTQVQTSKHTQRPNSSHNTQTATPPQFHTQPQTVTHTPLPPHSVNSDGPLLLPLHLTQPSSSSPLLPPPPPLFHPPPTHPHPDQSPKIGSDAPGPDAAKPAEEKKRVEKEGSKGEKEDGGGWFPFFRWKKSKQAVLPDDKNPSIVWDEEKKKWVNQDGEEEVTAPPPPPPRSLPSGPPHLVRGGLRKMRYVNTERDPSKASGMPPMNPMLPPMPSQTPPMPGQTSPMPSQMPSMPGPPMSASPQPFMMPQTLPPQQQQQEQQGAPQPHLPTDVPQGMLSEESADGEAGAVPMMGAPPPPGGPSTPQFFNPAQFAKPSGPGMGSAGGSLGRRGRRGGGYPGKR